MKVDLLELKKKKNILDPKNIFINLIWQLFQGTTSKNFV